jgi:hypothetical protein
MLLLFVCFDSLLEGEMKMGISYFTCHKCGNSGKHEIVSERLYTKKFDVDLLELFQKSESLERNVAGMVDPPEGFEINYKVRERRCSSCGQSYDTAEVAENVLRRLVADYEALTEYCEKLEEKIERIKSIADDPPYGTEGPMWQLS